MTSTPRPVSSWSSSTASSTSRIRLAFGRLRERVKRDIERGLPAVEGGDDDLTYPTVAALAER